MNITLPLTNEIIETLHARDIIYLTGVIYTARDAAHKRLKEMIDNKQELPINLHEQIIYYTGPTPSKDGIMAGSIGPTTSSRMDSYRSLMDDLNIRATIGKGQRSIEIRQDATHKKRLYLMAIGGIGAKLSLCVEKIKIVAFNDLGPEAIYELQVKNFPVIVAYDIYGKSVFREENI